MTTHLDRWKDAYSKRRDTLFGHCSDSAAEQEAVVAQCQAYVLPIIGALVRLPTKHVLDFGCGSGRWTNGLSRISESYTGVDMLEPALALAHASHPDKEYVLVNPNEPLPFRSDSFSVVLTCCVLQHCIESAFLKTVIQESVRVLAKDGLFVSIENCSDKKAIPDWIIYRDPIVYAKYFMDAGLAEAKHTSTFMKGRESHALMIHKKD